MQVTLLGTSSAEGWPGLFCRCAACYKARALGGKNLRTRSSALIDNTLKIDFPPDTHHHILRFGLDLRCMSALLFTHAHDDHFSPAELQYMDPYFVPVPISEILPVYGPPGVIERLGAALDLSRLPLSLHALTPWKTVSIGEYRVTPVLAQHDPSQVCFNYILQNAEGVTLLYASDTGWYEEATWRFLETFTFDGIVAECSKGPIEGGYMAHLCIPEVIRMRQRLLAAGC
ncbi:MAG TPA: MBL fold metallo-hydrolase, partial [Chthonomonadaceae bacterium]|nr:MBL fold metallo-hydrolase [Chthonomonadaceae bacterium]